MTSFIPAIYHPLILILIGIWGYTTTLMVLDWQGIHVNSLVFTHQNKSLNQFESFLLLSATLTWFLLTHLVLLENMLLVQYATLLDYFSPAVFCYSLFSCILLFGPCAKETHRFLRCLYRLVFYLVYPQVYFSDVLVADILISFSGVLTLLCIQMISQISNNLTIAPIITSIPYLIRLKQCINDYVKGYSKRHLLNAFKYSLSIPVTFLAYETTQTSYNSALWYLWLTLAILSHIYAFGWDIVMDWGLFQYNSGLIRWRKDGWFSDSRWYLAAIVLNFNIRLFKIVTSVYPMHSVYIDFFEIVRRWIWVVFRFEYEWVKSSSLSQVKFES